MSSKVNIEISSGRCLSFLQQHKTKLEAGGTSLWIITSVVLVVIGGLGSMMLVGHFVAGAPHFMVAMNTAVSGAGRWIPYAMVVCGGAGVTGIVTIAIYGVVRCIISRKGEEEINTSSIIEEDKEEVIDDSGSFTESEIDENDYKMMLNVSDEITREMLGKDSVKIAKYEKWKAEYTNTPEYKKKQAEGAEKQKKERLEFEKREAEYKAEKKARLEQDQRLKQKRKAAQARYNAAKAKVTLPDDLLKNDAKIISLRHNCWALNIEERTELQLVCNDKPHLVIPRAGIHSEWDLVEEKLSSPPSENIPMTLFYLDNLDACTEAIEQFTRLLLEVDVLLKIDKERSYEKFDGFYSTTNDFEPSYKRALYQYAPFVRGSNEDGNTVIKIGLRRFKYHGQYCKGELTPEKLEWALQQMIIYYPYHFDKIIKVGKKYGTVSDARVARLKAVQKYQTDYLDVYVTKYREWLDEKGVTAGTVDKKLEVTEKQKEDFVADVKALLSTDEDCGIDVASIPDKWFTDYLDQFLVVIQKKHTILKGGSRVATGPVYRAATRILYDGVSHPKPEHANKFEDVSRFLSCQGFKVCNILVKHKIIFACGRLGRYMHC